MENINENDYQRNYECLMKLYNFQELMRKFKGKNTDEKFYLINPESLKNYHEYYSNQEIKSYFSNNINKIKKSKDINKTKLPILEELNHEESSYKEIKSIYKIKKEKREINLQCYNKIIIVNEEIKNLMCNIKNFIPEKVIFNKDNIAIPLKDNIFQIFQYENIKRVCRPRYIMIFPDKIYADKSLKELENTELSNYLYIKKIKDHIVNESLYNDKNKEIGKVISFHEILKEIKNKEKEIKKENYMQNIKTNLKFNKPNKNLLEKENDIINEEEKDIYNSNDLKVENNNFNYISNTNQNNNNIPLSNENILIKDEKSKEKSISGEFEEDIKDSIYKKGKEMEEEEKKESKISLEEDIKRLKDDKIVNSQIQSKNDVEEKEKNEIQSLEQIQKDHSREEEIKNDEEGNSRKEEIKNDEYNNNKLDGNKEENKIKKSEEEKSKDENSEKNKEKEIIKNSEIEEKKEELFERKVQESEIFEEQKQIEYIDDKEKSKKEEMMKEKEKINEENKINEKKELSEDQKRKDEEKIKEKQNIDEQIRIKEEERKKEEELNKKEQEGIKEENRLKEEHKIKEDEILNEENRLKEENKMKLKKENEIKNNLNDEEIQYKNKEEEINNKMENEELLREKLEYENNHKIMEEENKKIIEKEKKEQKEQEEMKYKNAHSIEALKEDPKIGLNNIGATCYMNATIQCFSRTTKISNYFLNPENINIFNKEKKLCHSYYNLITNLWYKQGDAASYSPYDFKNIISEMSPLFQGIAANDSKDLILFILQQLHEELKPEVNGGQRAGQDEGNADQTNRIAVLEEFKESMKNNVSLISELCFGMNEIVSDCLNCRQNGNPIIKYNFQIFNFIIFPLKEVSNYKKTKLDILNNNQNKIDEGEESVTIYDCFDQFVLPAIMTGDNMMFCNNCQQMSPTSYTTKIYSAPKILILILNRGKGNEFKIKINFEKIISIENYVEQKEEKELKYELYAVLTHLGTSDMNGHFIAFCYSIIDNIWYKFNDAFVDPITDFQKEVHDFEEPYILFYQKMN